MSGTFVGARLRSPIRENSSDLEWLKIPPVADNEWPDCHRKRYAILRPKSWSLRDTGVSSLGNNIAIIPRPIKGGHGRGPRHWAGSVGTYGSAAAGGGGGKRRETLLADPPITSTLAKIPDGYRISSNVAWQEQSPEKGPSVGGRAAVVGGGGWG